VSKVGKELSFQVKTMPYKHTYAPFNFEKGKRHMASAWMAKDYMIAFRDNPILKARDLKTIVKNATFLGLWPWLYGQ